MKGANPSFPVPAGDRGLEVARGLQRSHDQPSRRGRTAARRLGAWSGASAWMAARKASEASSPAGPAAADLPPRPAILSTSTETRGHREAGPAHPQDPTSPLHGTESPASASGVFRVTLGLYPALQRLSSGFIEAEGAPTTTVSLQYQIAPRRRLRWSRRTGSVCPRCARAEGDMRGPRTAGGRTKTADREAASSRAARPTGGGGEGRARDGRGGGRGARASSFPPRRGPRAARAGGIGPDALARDAAYAFRMLRKRLASAVCILTIASGWRQHNSPARPCHRAEAPAAPAPERLVRIFDTIPPHAHRCHHRQPADWRRRARSFTGIAGH
jgi:hypothetical protein